MSTFSGSEWKLKAVLFKCPLGLSQLNILYNDKISKVSITVKNWAVERYSWQVRDGKCIYTHVKPCYIVIIEQLLNSNWEVLIPLENIPDKY